MLDRSKLIDQTTGEFDWSFIKQRAVLRADHEFGGQGAPTSAVRDAIRYYKDLAQAMRTEWRKAHGLPDDTEYLTITPYASARVGIRSAF